MMMTTNDDNKKKTDWKKYLVFAGMGLLFAGAMYMILSPTVKKDDEQGFSTGLNMEIPDPNANELVDDKRTAFEQEQVRIAQQERMRTLADFIGIADVENVQEVSIEEPPSETVVIPPTTTQQRSQTSGGARSSAQSPLDAHREMSRTLEAFHEQPREDARVVQLQNEVEQLRNQLENQPQGTSIEEQLALMEKTYEMATRFMPQVSHGGNVGQGGQGGQMVITQVPTDTNVPSVPIVPQIPNVTPVSNVQMQIVSALSQAISNAEFVEAYSQERNTCTEYEVRGIGFHSAIVDNQQVSRNTIRALIHDDQTVSDGLESQRNVRIRLTEPMSVGGTVIPANTILTGQARIGERLEVTITSIEHLERIYATNIAVYDVDGQRGITIPPSMEVNAMMEIAANAGTSMGTSITFNQSAGQQVAADLGRGVIQGTSQYAAKKLRVVRIHLKAGHQIFLLPMDSL